MKHSKTIMSVMIPACVWLLGAGQAAGQSVITQIIDRTGDGAGNGLDSPQGIAVDGAGTVYVTGRDSDNAFKITPGGVITEIIDITGDGAGNVYVTGAGSENAFKITPAGVITWIINVRIAQGIAVDAAGNVYLTAPGPRTGASSVLKVTPAGVTMRIIDFSGDGADNSLIFAQQVAVDAAGNVYVTGAGSDNAFKITPGGVSDEPPDGDGGDGTGDMGEDGGSGDGTGGIDAGGSNGTGDMDAGGGDSTGDMDPTMEMTGRPAGAWTSYSMRLPVTVRARWIPRRMTGRPAEKPALESAVRWR